MVHILESFSLSLSSKTSTHRTNAPVCSTPRQPPAMPWDPRHRPGWRSATARNDASSTPMTPRSVFSMIFFESVVAFSFKSCYVMATVQQANKLLNNLFEAGMVQTIQDLFAVQAAARCSTQSRNLAERGLISCQLYQLCHLCWLIVGISCPNSEINK